MTIVLPEENKGEFELVPEGTYTAICYRIVDLGTQLVDFQGQQKQQHKIMISWELADANMSDQRPFTTHQKYTLSSHEKATMRKHLEAWRGKAFTQEEFGKFDIGVLIGKPCMQQIIHNHKNGNTYANIAAIMKMPKGLTAPALVNESLYFSLNNFNQEIYNKLSEGLQATIAKSPEYQRIKGAHKLDNVPDDHNGHTSTPIDDEIPF